MNAKRLRRHASSSGVHHECQRPQFRPPGMNGPDAIGDRKVRLLPQDWRPRTRPLGKGTKSDGVFRFLVFRWFRGGHRWVGSAGSDRRSNDMTMRATGGYSNAFSSPQKKRTHAIQQPDSAERFRCHQMWKIGMRLEGHGLRKMDVVTVGCANNPAQAYWPRPVGGGHGEFCNENPPCAIPAGSGA